MVLEKSMHGAWDFWIFAKFGAQHTDGTNAMPIHGPFRGRKDLGIDNVIHDHVAQLIVKENKDNRFRAVLHMGAIPLKLGSRTGADFSLGRPDSCDQEYQRP